MCELPVPAFLASAWDTSRSNEMESVLLFAHRALALGWLYPEDMRPLFDEDDDETLAERCAEAFDCDSLPWFDLEMLEEVFSAIRSEIN